MVSSTSSGTGLTLEGVSVAFGAVKALDGVSFDVEPGERLAIIGASGAGKSTLFRTLTRGVPLSGGRVVLGDKDLYSLSERELRRVRRGIGVAHQAYDLVPQLPSGANAALGAVGTLTGLRAVRMLLFGPGTALAKRVEEALERVGLREHASSRTADLSGGQQQRITIARLLVRRPSLVLADEPFAAVDPVTTDRVLRALLELNETGATLLANLHDVEIARRFPRVVALREGRVVFDGPPERLTGEELAAIYARDAYGSKPRPAPEYDAAKHGQIRITGGRDGISSH